MKMLLFKTEICCPRFFFPVEKKRHNLMQSRLVCKLFSRHIYTFSFPPLQTVVYNISYFGVWHRQVARCLLVFTHGDVVFVRFS